MRPLEECRKYEVLLPDGTWQPVHWEQLDKGDTIRCNPPLLGDIYHSYEPFLVNRLPYLSAEPLPAEVKL